MKTPRHASRDKSVMLTDLQQAWLTQIGIDRRLLAYYRRPETGPATVRPGPVDPAPAIPDTAARAPRSSGLQAARAAAGLLDRPTSSTQAPTPVADNPVGLQSVADHLARGAADTPLPADWVALHDHALACQACVLHAQRDQLVFGAGDLDHPDWLVVGEAPGQADDRTGLPFQGKAGQLLHAMFVAVGVHPESLALGGGIQGIPAWSRPARMAFTNLIKCRPLGNRSPEPVEIETCKPYLLKQIELLRPRRILVLGRLAAQALLQTDKDVEELRGRVHSLQMPDGGAVPLVVTWHPAALLMHPQNKGQAWADLNLARRMA